MARKDPLHAVGWLAGVWASESAEEAWTAPEGNAMVGINRSGEHVELLRIDAVEGELVYTAAPPGQAITAFRARPGAPLVFENPAHDFPKRITYARDGDRFTATISGDEGDRKASWAFTRRGDPPRPTQAPGTITTDLEALTLDVELPGPYCAQLVCAVLPTPAGPTLHVALIDSDLDCAAPARGSCALPSREAMPRVGTSTLTAPTWQGPIPHLFMGVAASPS